jgi:hypothetical protein
MWHSFSKDKHYYIVLFSSEIEHEQKEKLEKQAQAERSPVPMELLKSPSRKSFKRESEVQPIEREIVEKMERTARELKVGHKEGAHFSVEEVYRQLGQDFVYKPDRHFGHWMNEFDGHVEYGSNELKELGKREDDHPLAKAPAKASWCPDELDKKELRREHSFSKSGVKSPPQVEYLEASLPRDKSLSPKPEVPPRQTPSPQPPKPMLPKAIPHSDGVDKTAVKPKPAVPKKPTRMPPSNPVASSHNPFRQEVLQSKEETLSLETPSATLSQLVMDASKRPMGGDTSECMAPPELADVTCKVPLSPKVEMSPANEIAPREADIKKREYFLGPEEDDVTSPDITSCSVDELFHQLSSQSADSADGKQKHFDWQSERLTQWQKEQERLIQVACMWLPCACACYPFGDLIN